MSDRQQPSPEGALLGQLVFTMVGLNRASQDMYDKRFYDLLEERDPEKERRVYIAAARLYDPDQAALIALDSLGDHGEDQRG